MNPLRKQTSQGDKVRAGTKSPQKATADPGPSQPSAGEAIRRNPERLLEGFVDTLCRYVGSLNDLPMGADLSNRMYLLDRLDMARREGKLPWTVSAEQNIILGLSAYSVKLSRATQNPVLMLRIPIHEVASLSYINDDQEHLLFLKAGDAQKSHCKCHVISCKTKADAEQVCTILRQALQLVYSKPPLPASEHAPLAQRRQTSRKTAGMSSASPQPLHVEGTDDSEESSSDGEVALVSSKLVREAKRTSRLSKLGSPGNEDEEDDGSAEAVVQQYMERLNRLMGYQEIKEFAMLLRQYREDSMGVTEFCEKLLELYGTDRKFLLPGMSSFIPEEDSSQFLSFLAAQGVDGPVEEAEQLPQLDNVLAGINQEMGSVEQVFEHIDT